MNQPDLITRDALATMAAVWLADARSEDDFVNFPDPHPCETGMLEILWGLGLVDRGHGFIELGCVEHGVIHICHCRDDDESYRSHWLGIDPVSGCILFY